MTRDDDVRLLDAWRRTRDRRAMDVLIRRHIHFVYGAARRMVRDRSLAEDVTQAVFMLLIQKSPRVDSDRALTSWLHRTTRYASSNARRMHARRVDRDRRAARPEALPLNNQSEIDTADEHAWLMPILDDAIGALGSRDRDALLMCYFQKRSYREVGDAIGISEDAARKRISRAIERLRDHFGSRGVAVGDVALSGVLAHHIVEAPASLVHATLNITPALDLAAQCFPCAQIAQKVTHSMM